MEFCSISNGVPQVGILLLVGLSNEDSFSLCLPWEMFKSIDDN
ncbi:hypothetical protein CAPGI0001_0001 [Capnocytophaga gingivalis ATCC 33624]|nr:hypothetical protein CAPGI0001_0001 [Capnocytophaga gingivalis ATCC 33624]